MPESCIIVSSVSVEVARDPSGGRVRGETGTGEGEAGAGEEDTDDGWHDASQGSR